MIDYYSPEPIAELPDETAGSVSKVPISILQGLRQYALDHIPTGSFLYAVLANDLCRAVAHADPDNRIAFCAIADYVVHCLPAACWGSPAAVERWLRHQPADPQHEPISEGR